MGYNLESKYFKYQEDMVIKTFGTNYPRMDQINIVEDSLPQILLGSFLNTLSHFTYIVKFPIVWETEPIHCIQFCISPLPELLRCFGKSDARIKRTIDQRLENIKQD